jgi:hypothetical protein
MATHPAIPTTYHSFGLIHSVLYCSYCPIQYRKLKWLTEVVSEKAPVVLAFIENVLFALALFFLRVTVDELVAAVVTRHHNNEMVPDENGI